MTLEAIKYTNGKLSLLDQLKLPLESVYIDIETLEDGWNAINKMNVRGAPAIAIAGVLTVAAELTKKDFSTIEEIIQFTHDSMDYLISARPTAVNIHDAWSEKDKDPSKIKVLTHCNTGSLATAGYGTALGVVRKLHELEKLEHCFCTETRPYNQGSRLTAYELTYEKIPSTLICDNMAAMLMSKHEISAIVVGADRVVSNGDTANKIGTYQLALLASSFDVPFYVAVPSTTVDFTMASGEEIIIEERAHHEITHTNGVRVAAEINCWNPSFDVTPSKLITGGLITEHGVFQPHELAKLKELINSDL